MKDCQGFTLIEILVALMVFTIIAALTASVMYHAFDTKSRVAQHALKINQLQFAILTIDRDMQQIIARPVRGNEMHLFPAFVGHPHYLEITRMGVLNPDFIEKRSHLKRVAYICQNQQLIRRTWSTLDTINRNQFEDKLLLSNLSLCQFSYLNSTLEILSDWHETTDQINQDLEPLPKAIQFNLDFSSTNKLSFLTIIPEALYGE